MAIYEGHIANGPVYAPDREYQSDGSWLLVDGRWLYEWATVTALSQAEGGGPPDPPEGFWMFRCELTEDRRDVMRGWYAEDD